MKIFRHITLIAAGSAILLSSCQQGSHKRMDNLASNVHQVTAEEVIQTNKYTFVFVSDEENDYWIAINRANIIEGETYFWSVGSEMNNFTSNELNRNFERIFFIQDFTDQPITQATQMPVASMSGKPHIAEQKGIEIPKATGGITIAELFANRNIYDKKTITVSGQVVKFSENIMDRNWIHIQDGTKDAGNYDLTVTTHAFLNVGDIVTFEGIVALNKDFGAGYFYDIILEDARVK